MLGPQSMGYDRSPTMYSPEGRLIQVEYARESVRRGSIAIGVKSKHGVVLAGLLRIVDLNEPDQKVHKIDEGIYASFAGVAADGRVLVSRARLESQIFRMTYDMSIDVQGLSTKIGDYCQIYTQQGGLRPFGVGLLIGGVDHTGASLYYVDPGGGVISVKAKAIGEGDTEAISILKEKYNEDMPLDEIETLVRDVIKKIVKDIELDEENIVTIKIPV